MALLVVFSLSALGVWVSGALAAPAPPAPSLSESPNTSPTNSTSITFTFSDTQSGVTFQCSLDNAAFSACTSPKAYSALAQGSHGFQVQAVAGGKASSSTSYSWVVDTTPPTMSSIATADANPTKASSLHWTVTFSEPVSGVAANGGNFGLVTSGTGGTAPAVTGAAASGSVPTATWTVTASTTGATGTNSGSIGLNLTSKGSVKDAAGNALGGTVPVTGQAYTFDTTAPTVSSILRANPSPTNASSVSWTVTFSEKVNGVAKGNFSLAWQSGLTGTPSVTGVSGSGTTWTVTASTGSGTPLDGSAVWLQLNLSSPAGITDPAGNTLANSLNGSSAQYLIDKFTPAPVFTSTPPDPSYDATSTFVWTEQEPGDTFLCSEENGPYNIPCASPFTYSIGTGNNGQHQFGVEALDSLGNVSSGTTYTWKVQKGSIQDFTISGNVSGLLYPGGATRTVALTLTNPNSVTIYVTALSVSIDATSLPGGCSSSWFQVNPSNVSSATPVTIPANGSVTLPAQGVTAPTIQMTDSGNQNACKNATFNLSYSGSAHS
ncbi:MAG: hypothetical protein E6J20_18800 [Chloroflexi bacterium]|nr:MAG: hypothetical protein E6J20_18800 [Chloroflexota bacterium]